MSRSVITLMTLLAGWPLALSVRGQEGGAPITIDQLPCTFCHMCADPSQRYPCLRTCPRTSAEAIGKKMSRKHAPEVVVLDELEELYQPVPFDHQGHAHMAEMTTGCAVCHHYTTEGTEVPACKNCHEVGPQREDLRKPSLKAAYHRQCMGCHREWSGGTQCAACHPPKEEAGQPMPTARELLDAMPGPVPEPHTLIYEPEAKPTRPGTHIIFRHKEHIDRFGLTCAECHHEDSCSSCHSAVEEFGLEPKVAAKAAVAEGDVHRLCTACHDVENKDACDHCHWNEGERKPEPFDHGSTGWPLDDHHVKLGCRTCHEAVPFRKLNHACDACHSDWEPHSFDHAVTGQLLNKDHEDADCTECHAGREFDKPPTCDECHEEEEGISFPTQRPGDVVIPSQRESGGGADD